MTWFCRERLDNVNVPFRWLLFENVYQKLEVSFGDKILGVSRIFFVCLISIDSIHQIGILGKQNRKIK